jgi:hypothetical protein
MKQVPDENGRLGKQRFDRRAATLVMLGAESSSFFEPRKILDLKQPAAELGLDFGETILEKHRCNRNLSSDGAPLLSPC